MATDEHFEILVDGVPTIVTAIPFAFNTETRYRVNYNGTEHIFTWDSGLGRLAPINDDSSTMPVGVEEAISARLQSFSRG
jgi:hypothetical protein